jgi:plastocyanin
MKQALALTLLAIAACGGEDPVEPGSTTDQITVQDNQFNPPATTVPVNTTVTWTWTNGTASPHNVTFDQSSLTPSGDRTSGSFQKQFTTAGTFTYRCTNHVGMNGTVTVQ